MSGMRLWKIALGFAVLASSPAVHAQWAVVDVGAITQLVQQVRTMQEQLATARNLLRQSEATLDAMRGGRGMDQLLGGVARNYLPADWLELEAAIRNPGGGSGALGAQIQALMNANAVLTMEQLATLSPAERVNVMAARESAALLRAMTREALRTTSGRFASIQQLIGAISGAQDQKAILDLQARIAAEQGMLENEQTKLTVLYQAAQAEEWARVQREREQAIADVGSMRRLPPMGLR